MVLSIRHLLGIRRGVWGLRSPHQVEPLGHSAHDEVLHLVPAVHDLVISDPDDVVAEEQELSIVTDIAVALRTDVGAAVDLKHEPISDEEIDAMPHDPHPRDDRQS